MNSVATGETAPDPAALKIWGTKGGAFWTLLGAILLRARPASILEFGGGRSTTVLADYAVRQRVPLLCIEQSDEWRRKIEDDLRFMHIHRAGLVHHVPLAPTGSRGPGWYDPARVRALLAGRAFDLVFLDGPQGGARRNPEGQAVVAEAAREARLIIVDDVHRPYNLAVFRRLTERMGPRSHFYFTYGNNLLGLASEVWEPVVRSSLRHLELPVLKHPPAASAALGESDDE
jgi:predicted O-methyltransferase YrrM